METRHFAHTHPDCSDTSTWEPLYTACSEECPRCRELAADHGHLEKVASLVVIFVEQMYPPGQRRAAIATWAYQAGLWHDIGKFSREFQDYLQKAGGSADPHAAEVSKSSPTKVDHSTAGAKFAKQHCGPLGILLAYALAGHHSGLLDGRTSGSSQSSLEARLLKNIYDAELPADFPQPSPLPLPPLCLGENGDRAHKVAVFVRMLFSALVDADFLATEAFMSPVASKDRPVWPANILSKMQTALNHHLEGFSSSPGKVNEARADILRACLEKAALKPGLFTLTVPTGGGKTLSSMAFALNHALANDMQRVIYVIPFTSIIEQNADVFHGVFQSVQAELGNSPVLEHHSNLDPAKDTTRNRLASENWDSPLVITTNVQFLESLFANRTRRCRKLHRIARSVIIFDEAQNLPVSYLSPCLSALRILIQDYGCTIVLCTATQPAIIKRDNFPIGLSEPTEIIDDVPTLFEILKRTKFQNLGKVSDEELLERLKAEPGSALTIVNTRRHASTLFQQLQGEDGIYHLSAQMCPDHRSQTIYAIRQELAAGKPCKVISTQLIEAGVDLDFQVVYRALAGIDSIAQAAGRCNREGKHPLPGQVYIFEPEVPIPRGHLRSCADTARGLINEPDLLRPEILRSYFEQVYWKHTSEWDQHQILANFQITDDMLNFQFRTAAEKFRLIDQEMNAIIVPWGDEYEYQQVVNELKHAPFASRKILRKVQRLTVQVHPWTFGHLLTGKQVEPIDEEKRFFQLTDTRLYDPKIGLLTEAGAFYNAPENLMCT